jgi:hypothetical protein
MALTLLNQINALFKQASIIEGATSALTDLTDTALQTSIDVGIKAWNEALDELFKTGVYAGETAAGSIALVTDQREYSLASDFISMNIDPIDATNGRILLPYPQGMQGSAYEAMVKDQLIPADFDGQPNFYVINPTTGLLRVDRNPTSEVNGDTFGYHYDKETNIALAEDTFPISDDAVRALESATLQIYNRKRKGQFDKEAYLGSLALAASKARQSQPRKSYGPRYARHSS